MVDLHVQIAPKHARGLLLANPVMTASGTFGYGVEYENIINVQKLGAIVCKGTTLKPRDGNPQPRIVETTSGILNWVGLQNIGVEALIHEIAPVWAQWNVKVIVNIAGESISDYGEMAKKLRSVKGISALEVNISCPNVSAGGMEFGTNPKVAAAVTKSVIKNTDVPVIVKLSPNVTDIVEIAIAVTEAGADAITLINTLKGMAINNQPGNKEWNYVIGGLSGPAIKPVALYMVYRVAQKVDIPVIGCGGIYTGEDAMEFIMAGASAIQVGTANLTNPDASITVLTQLESILDWKKIKNLEQIRGSIAG
jgi:dihydroorotate dehydrogenase (NAD+) catalytic subunit